MSSLGQVHQQLLHNYDARVISDRISDDDDNNGFNNQGQRVTGDSNCELETFPGTERQSPAILKTPDRDQKADSAMSAENNLLGLERNGSGPSSSDAASRPQFENITQGEAYADSKGLGREAPETYVGDMCSALYPLLSKDILIPQNEVYSPECTEMGYMEGSRAFSILPFPRGRTFTSLTTKALKIGVHLLTRRRACSNQHASRCLN